MSRFSQSLHPRFLLLCRFLGRRHDDVIHGLWRCLSEVAALFNPAYLALTQSEASCRSANDQFFTGRHIERNSNPAAGEVARQAPQGKLPILGLSE
jgi:hypothetical protein